MAQPKFEMDWKEVVKEFHHRFLKDGISQRVYIDCYEEQEIINPSVLDKLFINNVTEKWCPVVLLDAVICSHGNSDLRLSTRRSFDQHCALRQSIEAVFRAAISANMLCMEALRCGEIDIVASGIEDPWTSFEYIRTLIHTCCGKGSNKSTKICQGSCDKYPDATLPFVLNDVVKRTIGVIIMSPDQIGRDAPLLRTQEEESVTNVKSETRNDGDEEIDPCGIDLLCSAALHSNSKHKQVSAGNIAFKSPIEQKQTQTNSKANKSDGDPEFIDVFAEDVEQRIGRLETLADNIEQSLLALIEILPVVYHPTTSPIEMRQSPRAVVRRGREVHDPHHYDEDNSFKRVRLENLEPRYNTALNKERHQLQQAHEVPRSDITHRPGLDSVHAASCGTQQPQRSRQSETEESKSSAAHTSTPPPPLNVGHWTKIQPSLLKGAWCTAGSVVGVFMSGVGSPLPSALLIGVCAAVPDTQAVKKDVASVTSTASSKDSPIDTKASGEQPIYVPIYTNTSMPIPVLMTHLRDMDFFRCGDDNMYLCVDEAGCTILMDGSGHCPSGTAGTKRVFAIALRDKTKFSADGLPEPVNGLRGVLAMLTHILSPSYSSTLSLPPSSFGSARTQPELVGLPQRQQELVGLLQRQQELVGLPQRQQEYGSGGGSSNSGRSLPHSYSFAASHRRGYGGPLTVGNMALPTLPPPVSSSGGSLVGNRDELPSYSRPPYAQQHQAQPGEYSREYEPMKSYSGGGSGNYYIGGNDGVLGRGSGPVHGRSSDGSIGAPGPTYQQRFYGGGGNSTGTAATSLHLSQSEYEDFLSRDLAGQKQQKQQQDRGRHSLNPQAPSQIQPHQR